MFVTYHGKHLCHGMIDTLDAAISARMVGACHEVLYFEYVVL